MWFNNTFINNPFNVSNDCPGIIKFIEAQNKLNDVKFIYTGDEAFHKILEESLIKHANTMQYLQIT